MVTWCKPLLAALIVACVAFVAACGSSNSSSSASSSAAPAAPASTSTSTTAASSSSSGADPAVVKLVPAAIKSKGTLVVASDATYAPDEFIASDGHTVIGMDADLSKALATVMGLKAKLQNATFATIIPGLAAGKYDMGASSFSDNKEREKTVDFVDYFIAGESFITKASGGTSISSISDICGKTVAVEKGTTEEADAGTQSKKCQSAGKPAVKILSFSDQNQANLALSSGRAQLGFLDSPIAAYQVKQTGGQFKVVGAAYATGPYGLALPKGSLAPAVLAALKVVMENGTYDSILKHWGLTEGAIPAAQVKINGATS
ncbi:MAG TPA: ABC transporter substrate-binding protein [Solirubrobacteraceae bacterium]|nr:ABC transporter substrate-binding protein [Solirubrobacteraceae bacterium]